MISQGREVVGRTLGRGVLREVLEGKKLDRMLTHFQCDLYHFLNIKGRYLNRLRQ